MFDLLPKAAEILQVEPEEVARLLLLLLNDPQRPAMFRNAAGLIDISFLINFSDDFTRYVQGRPIGEQDQIRRQFAEAWAWLEREGLVARFPSPHAHNLFFVTRRGLQVRTAADYETYKRGHLLPRQSFHPTLAEKVTPLFLRGDYDTAIFQAFKEIELSARNAAKLPDTLFGTTLMRKAFDPETGQLSDPKQAKAERQATADLFAGAIGLFKNPSSHRRVDMEPLEAGELIHLANFMLRLIDSRSLEPAN